MMGSLPPWSGQSLGDESNQDGLSSFSHSILEPASAISQCPPLVDVDPGPNQPIQRFRLSATQPKPQGRGGPIPRLLVGT